MKNISILLLLLVQGAVAQAQVSFENAKAYQMELEEIKVLGVVKNYGPHRVSAQFFNDNDRLLFGYPAYESGAYRQKVSLMRLKTGVVHQNFRGSNIQAISPDGNRILLGGSIYDMEQGKTFELGVSFLNNIAWLDDDKIYTYDSSNKYTKTIPSRYYYIDLNDLQSKSMSQEEIKVVLGRIDGMRPRHPNFYLSRTSRSGSIYIYSRNTPYVKTLLPFKNGYPIKWFMTSPDVQYVVVNRSSERYKNSTELILYRLKAKNKELKTRFTINDPSNYFGEEFKKEYDNKGAIGIRVDVYEPKINPLNDKKIGANKSTFKGNMKVIDVLSDGSWVLEIGYHVSDIKAGLIATNFRRNDQSPKETRGVWTTLKD
jgi:hypothetical protein